MNRLTTTILLFISLLNFNTSASVESKSGVDAQNEYILNRASAVSDIVIICPFEATKTDVSKQVGKTEYRATIVGVLKGKAVFGDKISFEKHADLGSPIFQLGHLRFLLFDKINNDAIVVHDGESPVYSEWLFKLLMEQRKRK
jgi:hypothetical protein